jgi:DNA-binding NtrC family response regulator
MLCLIVDDDPSIRNFVRAILRTEDFETIEADGGAAALEMVHKLGGSVDLIITDIQMPGGDGRMLASQVAAAFPAVRVIVMSGYGEDRADRDFVAKPFSWETMLGVVRRVLARAA